jgi:hypothetical protein
MWSTLAYHFKRKCSFQPQALVLWLAVGGDKDGHEVTL